MNHKILIACMVSMGVLTLFAQPAKKPTLMIVPSDNWCIQRYFTRTFEDQGRQVRVSDYQRAFQEDTEIGGVIGKVGELLTDRGYSLKDCEQEMKAIAMREAEDNVTTSKTNNAMLAESPLDQLKRRTKSDIIIQIDWQIHKKDNGKYVTFTLAAFDSYTSKRIATATGTNKWSNEPIPVVLEAAVLNYMDAFAAQMLEWYQGMLANGREIVMNIRCWDNWDKDLETEYNGDELLDCIQKWLAQNTVNGNFNLTDNTETMAQFEQVRIPLQDESGKAMDARAFAIQLRKYLEKEYQIISKVMVRGLGEANLILGEK